MKLVINDEVREITEVDTLADLLKKLGLSPERLAVEINSAVLTPEEYESTHLKNDDRIELVRFVGGG